MGEFIPGRDAAYAQNIGSFAGVVGGYLGGPNAWHTWADADWLMFARNPKLPIWVAGYEGRDEADAALGSLGRLRVPPGCVCVLDMETRVDKTYVDNFARTLRESRGAYKTLVYGSIGTVFGNPQCNGYWVANPDEPPTEHMAINPASGDTLGIRGTQWMFGDAYDSSAWKPWVISEFWL